jgi:hypothetical protein
MKSGVSSAVVLAGVALAGCGGTGLAAQSKSEPAHLSSTAGRRLPARFFARDAVWNTPIPPHAALDPTSAARSAALANQATGIGSMINTVRYSVPVYTVGLDQPTVKVETDTSSRKLAAATAAVPLPPGAQPAAGTDRHLVVWQPSTDTMWEFWKLREEPDGWHAGYGGRMVDVQSSRGYFRRAVGAGGRVRQQLWWGATATGLPLVGGLITVPDLKRGRIDHALALGVPRVERGVRAFPAQRSDGRSTGLSSIPEGARFRLDPRLRVSSLGLPPAMRMIAEAAQRYGLIVRDGSGAVSLYAEDPKPLGRNPYGAYFAGLPPYKFAALFPWGRLQLLKMRLTRNSG